MFSATDSWQEDQKNSRTQRRATNALSTGTIALFHYSELQTRSSEVSDEVASGILSKTKATRDLPAIARSLRSAQLTDLVNDLAWARGYVPSISA